MNPKDRLRDLVPFHWGLSFPLLLGNVMCDQHTAIQLSVQHLHILTAAYSHLCSFDFSTLWSLVHTHQQYSWKT